jgi:hypothetical protein
LKTTACAAANLKGRRRSLGVRAEAQKTRGASRSSTGFAPMCSTLLRQCWPR